MTKRKFNAPLRGEYDTDEEFNDSEKAYDDELDAAIEHEVYERHKEWEE